MIRPAYISHSQISLDKYKYLIQSIIMKKVDATIVGGGLAGSEAAWQIANRGFQVSLYEMRPYKETGAHVTGYLAELVCSNSLGSNLSDRASGLLKNELKKLNSLLIDCAEQSAVPAGGALAVDRELFAASVTHKIEMHPNINIIREECREIPEGLTIISSGPLTSSSLAGSIAGFSGTNNLFFFDAIAPIVSHESINMDRAFRLSRHHRGVSILANENSEGDYINCPMDEGEYYHFVEQLVSADRIELKNFELEMEKGVKTGAHHFFEGCLPVEILARRGKDALAFGPMRPIGLRDPRTGKRPYAVVQLRQDNFADSLYNLVGFQTNLTFPEQRRIFRLIPGLEKAEFMRYGQMHRNTFIFSPGLLSPSLQSLRRPDLFFAGQITGVEGYAGNIATGLLAGLNCVRYLQGEQLYIFPKTTMLGALCNYITNANEKDYQPMKANFGILPPLPETHKKMGKRERAQKYAGRAIQDLENYIKNNVEIN